MGITPRAARCPLFQPDHLIEIHEQESRFHRSESNRLLGLKFPANVHRRSVETEGRGLGGLHEACTL